LVISVPQRKAYGRTTSTISNYVLGARAIPLTTIATLWATRPKLRVRAARGDRDSSDENGVGSLDIVHIKLSRIHPDGV
jgi:hypothetical protein